MGNTVNRDRLRGMLSELQTMTGKRVSATRHLMSKRDCYNAIYELMKLELGINTKNENETLKRLNKTLNEVNCEVNQDREEMRKEIENLKKEKEELTEKSIKQIREFEEQGKKVIKEGWDEAEKIFRKKANIEKTLEKTLSKLESTEMSLRNYKNDFDMQVLKNEKLEKELFKSKIINRVCYVGLAFIMGVNLW